MQEIHITSYPPEARVVVNGVITGITPVDAYIPRRRSSLLVRVEKDGFRPAV
jgi:hypothetical protein